MTSAEKLAHDIVESMVNRLKRGAKLHNTPAGKAADKAKIACAIQKLIDDAVEKHR